MKIYLVSIPQINEVWDKVEKLISNACEFNNNRFSCGDIRKLLDSGEQQLWIAINEEISGLAITSIQTFPQKKCCVIEMFTGHGLEELLSNFHIIEEWGRELGCTQMFAHARVGLARKLRPQNYIRTHEVLEKNL